jgi:hypothetical protein
MLFPVFSEAVHIQMLQDLLLIELNDFTLETAYVVKNDEDKIVRKGKFIGHQVQINFIHLPSGHYSLGLNHGEEAVSYYFEKNDGFYTFSQVYTSDAAKKFVA